MQHDSLVRKSVRWVRSLVGQRAFYRGVRLLMYEATFDVLNDPATNGELYLQRIVLQYSPRAIVFDVGANVGDWTAMLVPNSPQVFVHAFEPCDGTFAVLQDRLSSAQVRCIRAACSDHVGSAHLSVSVAGAGTNALSDSGEAVNLTTIDHYCSENSITHIDLLKIDAEGYDFLVLAGSRRMLERHAVDVIQFEYNHRWMSTRKLLKDAFDLLIPMGYAIGKLTGNAIQFYDRWHYELESYREGNYVACLAPWKDRFAAVPAAWSN